MASIQVFLEQGQRKSFAGALEWPGWSRSGRDGEEALHALLDYGPRYAQVVGGIGLIFPTPEGVGAFEVVERHEGDATTDFGAPAAVLTADRPALDQAAYDRFQAILRGCWAAFDRAAEGAEGRELRKGPRGGGRSLDKILNHVLQSDLGYLRRLAWKHKLDKKAGPRDQMPGLRLAMLEALEAGLRGELPDQGPRGGVVWPPRYFVRRVAWHVLDHAWEIEDRVLP